MARERPMTAAGAVVWRRATPTQGGGRSETRQPLELLVVHRPRYDDWTFPKGKPDPGEDLVATAVREVAEETGHVVRLGHPLPAAAYRVAAGPKQVSYWVARSTGTTDPPFEPNKEVDEVRWVRTKEARRLLTYDHDLDLLDAFDDLREAKTHKARTLVVLRHGKALARSEWDDDDLERPLAPAGTDRARELAGLLAAYGVRRVVSSPAVRCTQTVDPYAHRLGTFVEVDDRLSEQTRRSAVQRSLAALLDRKKPVVLCSHRPTLPWVFSALGLDDPGLAPGEGLVVHHRKGAVVATEPLGRPPA